MLSVVSTIVVEGVMVGRLVMRGGVWREEGVTVGRLVLLGGVEGRRAELLVSVCGGREGERESNKVFLLQKLTFNVHLHTHMYSNKFRIHFTHKPTPLHVSYTASNMKLRALISQD